MYGWFFNPKIVVCLRTVAFRTSVIRASCGMLWYGNPVQVWTTVNSPS